MSTIHVIETRQPDAQAISLEQALRRKAQRRRRVAMRMYKRFPLFAVEFMQEEFPGYDWDTYVLDVTKKTRKSKSVRKAKSPLTRMGRYPLYQKAMAMYHSTGDQKHLEEAQHWRDRLHLDYEVRYSMHGQVRYYRYGPHVPYRIIEELGAIRFDTWEELEAKVKEITRYVWGV